MCVCCGEYCRGVQCCRRDGVAAPASAQASLWRVQTSAKCSIADQAHGRGSLFRYRLVLSKRSGAVVSVAGLGRNDFLSSGGSRREVSFSFISDAGRSLVDGK